MPSGAPAGVAWHHGTPGSICAPMRNVSTASPCTHAPDVVAGGETSGACVQALEIARMKVGPQIDPGVPWCWARTDAERGAGVHLALKSGNFGADDFFAKAFGMLQ